MKVVLVSTYPPRRCGLAAFAADLRGALSAAVPQWTVEVCAVDRDGLSYGPEVVEVVRQDSRDDYRRAGRMLAVDGADLVVIQHEYGIFGGPDGSYVLDLADELREQRVPYVVTLHTVLSAPTAGQGATLTALCRDAARVTGFTVTARRLATRTGVAAATKLVVVPHGAPAVLRPSPGVDIEIESESEIERSAGGPDRSLGPAVRDALRGLGSARMLATFGLIGPGKGLEIAISALPAVLARHPDVRYLIAGATHPEVARHGDESYRTGLVALANALGVAGHVRFLDAFLTDAELAALLARTDLYLTPYRSADQICSGALTFALAAGCPVVSTAYPYAREMLTPGGRPACGALVPFDDPVAFAAAVVELLDDPRRLAAARDSAREVGAGLLWPSVAARFASVFREAAQATRAPRAGRAPGVPGPRAGQAPGVPGPRAPGGLEAPATLPVRLGHLDELIDEIGIIQFARRSTPELESGYCVDDAARLAIVAAGLITAPAPLRVRDPAPVRWLAAALRLLEAGLADGGMHNVLGYDGIWRDRPHLGDHVGRACWALGTVAGRRVPADLREQARRLLDAAAPLVPKLTAPRCRAYAVLGLTRLDEPVPGLATALRAAAAGLVSAVSGDPGWHWYEPRLSYDNARLPQALLAAGDRLGKPAMVDTGLSTLDWYLTEIGLHGADPVLRLVGNEWRDRDGASAGDGGDEQPLDAAATVEALLAAWRLTGKQRYATLAGRAFMWFHGLNRAGVPLYDPRTGGCRDGLSATAANPNQGAESTLAYYQALLAMAESGLVALAARPVLVSIAGGAPGRPRAPAARR